MLGKGWYKNSNAIHAMQDKKGNNSISNLTKKVNCLNLKQTYTKQLLQTSLMQYLLITLDNETHFIITVDEQINICPLKDAEEVHQFHTATMMQETAFSLLSIQEIKKAYTSADHHYSQVKCNHL